MVELLSGEQASRRRYSQRQTHYDYRIQRRASGIENCKTRGECLRRKLDIASGTKLELCYAVHAEQNAIAQAAKLGISVDGATLYCTHQPCVICCKMIINSGIKRVVYCYGYPDAFSMELFREANITVEQLNEE